MSNKQVVLIVPKDNVCADPMIYPPLGLLYVAAVLENAGYDVIVYDMREEENTIENCPHSSVYGFTSATPQFNEVQKSVQYLKSRDPGSFTVLGGHFASWQPKEAIKFFDCVVVGEAEAIILGIIERRQCGIVDAVWASKRQNVSDIPFPARHLMNKERIISEKITGGKIATTIISSRGCPHRCAFCANLPQKVRYRSSENFIAEIKQIVRDYNCRSFKFLDDNFLVNLNHVKSICNGIKDLGITYRISARSDVLTEEKCLLLKSSGIDEVALGIESADDVVLKKIHKRETVADHRAAIALLKKHDISVRIYLMVGLPGETKETIEKTKQFILETRPDRWIVSMLVPFPGSPIWENPESYGVETENVLGDWSRFMVLPPMTPLHRTKNFSSKELVEQHRILNDFLRETKK